MSLPPGFLDELRDRTSLADLVGRKVSWDRRKTNQAKGDWWAPCPFHAEKTASFHVDDKKGYYYCFGCQAKGDAISFLRESENLSFMEAVEVLAQSAGVDMPARDPEAKARDNRRTGLAEVMEAAVRFFRQGLASAAAEPARAYLDGRGVAEASRTRFEIGFAAPSRRALYEHLRQGGVEHAAIIACGLAAEPDGGGPSYDRFRDRIIFPIRDGRGRAVAFGGRAMSSEARAKYLNSPETELFDKSRTLFNLGPARAAVGKGAPLVVTEGYMDVIALVEGGFEGAVAPLGTAVTEAQLELMWKIATEPVIALDGDPAGLRAAYRLIELALPRLVAGRGLRFALLPPGQDPDDVIRAQGPRAMADLLGAAMPMVDLLWQRETEGRRFDSPERRAGLEARLMGLTGEIGDATLRQHYRRALKDRLWEAFRKPPGRRLGSHRGAGGAAKVPVLPLAATRASALGDGDERETTEALREMAVLALLVAAPDLIGEVEDRLAAVPMSVASHAALRGALLAWAARPEGSVRDALAREVGDAVLEKLLRHPHVALIPAIRRSSDLDDARQCLEEELSKLEAQRGWEDEMRDADEGALDERTVWRLTQANHARQATRRAGLEDRGEFETGPNGLKIDRAEREAFGALIRSLSERALRRD